MTATAVRRSTPPVQTHPFRTWTPEPEPLTQREDALLGLARESFNRNPEAAVLTLSAESLQAVFRRLDYVEADRDRLGDHGVTLLARATRAEAQLQTLLQRLAPITAWAAKRLKCGPKLDEIARAILRSRR